MNHQTNRAAPAAQPEPLTEGQLDGLAIAMCAFAGRATNPTKDGALEVLRAVVSHPRFAAQPAAQPEVEEMRARKDAAYEERNKVVAALARLFPSGIARTAIEGWSDDWHGCVYIDLPTGQVSWHFHDSQAHLFDGLPPYKGTWDGHDTPEKYRRLAALCASPAAHPAPAQPDAPHPPSRHCMCAACAPSFEATPSAAQPVQAEQAERNRDLRERLDAMPIAPAQPVQAESVGYVNPESLKSAADSDMQISIPLRNAKKYPFTQPLYTAPPARDPAWVEEAMRLARSLWRTSLGSQAYRDAVDALRKHLES